MATNGHVRARDWVVKALAAVAVAFVCTGGALLAVWAGETRESGVTGRDKAARAEHKNAKDEHEGHDHGKAEAKDEHEGHDHGDDGDDEHAGHAEDTLRLTAEERESYGIALRTAGPGSLAQETRLSGEIVLNDDRVAHLVPRVGGLVREVRKTVGDRVEEGEVLAVLESAELGEAKVTYLSRLNEVGCCRILVPRRQAVHDNTLKLLAHLDTSPALDSLEQFRGMELGENRSRLLESYSELFFSRKAYERERSLHEKKIASQQDFLEAENALRKAEAQHEAERDTIAFAVKRELLEALAEQRAAGFALKQAERQLRFLGVNEEDIADLGELIPPPAPAACTDPTCAGCRAAADPAVAARRENRKTSAEARLTTYELRAPFAGVVTERHIALGEPVGEESDVFTVADLSVVWADLSVHLRDLGVLRVGQEVVLESEYSRQRVRAVVAALSPVVNEVTRTATARLVVDNADGRWRPGTFVTGYVRVSEDDVAVVVPRSAVQTVGESTVVFVEHEGAFELTPVRTGRGDRNNVEITAGLEAGAVYVTEGAFELKAKLVTSSLGSHAGHGH